MRTRMPGLMQLLIFCLTLDLLTCLSGNSFQMKIKYFYLSILCFLWFAFSLIAGPMDRRKGNTSTAEREQRERIDDDSYQSEEENQDAIDDQELGLDSVRQKADSVIEKWKEVIKQSDSWDQGSLVQEAQEDLEFWRNKNSELLIQLQREASDSGDAAKKEKLDVVSDKAAEAAQAAEEFLQLQELQQAIIKRVHNTPEKFQVSYEGADKEWTARDNSWEQQRAVHDELQQSRKEVAFWEQKKEQAQQANTDEELKKTRLGKIAKYITRTGQALNASPIGMGLSITGGTLDLINSLNAQISFVSAQVIHEEAINVNQTKQETSKATQQTILELERKAQAQEEGILQHERDRTFDFMSQLKPNDNWQDSAWEEWSRQVGEVSNWSSYQISRIAQLARKHITRVEQMTYLAWEQKIQMAQKQFQTFQQTRSTDLASLRNNYENARKAIDEARSTINQTHLHLKNQRQAQEELEIKLAQLADEMTLLEGGDQKQLKEKQKAFIQALNQLESLCMDLLKKNQIWEAAFEQELDAQLNLWSHSHAYSGYEEKSSREQNRLKARLEAAQESIEQLFSDHALRSLARQYEEIAKPIEEHERYINNMFGLRNPAGDLVRWIFKFPTYKGLVAKIVEDLENPITESKLVEISETAKRVGEKTNREKTNALLEEAPSWRLEKYNHWKSKQDKYGVRNEDDDDRDKEPTGARFYQGLEDQETVKKSEKKEKELPGKQEQVKSALEKAATDSGLYSKVGEEVYSEEARKKRKGECDNDSAEKLASGLASLEGHDGVIESQDKGDKTTIAAKDLKQLDDRRDAADRAKEEAEKQKQKLKKLNPNTPNQVNSQYITQRQEKNTKEKKDEKVQLGSWEAAHQGKQNDLKQAISERSYWEYWVSGSKEVDKAADEALEVDEKVQQSRNQLGALAVEYDQLGKTAAALSKKDETADEVEKRQEDLVRLYGEAAEKSAKEVDDLATQTGLPLDRNKLKKFGEDALPGHRTQDCKEDRKEAEERNKEFKEGECIIQ